MLFKCLVDVARRSEVCVVIEVQISLPLVWGGGRIRVEETADGGLGVGSISFCSLVDLGHS